MIPFISILLVFSGVASLIYQVTWVRLLGLSLGSTSASISTVLTAFFLGLALGSYLTERLTRAGGGSFRLYGMIEGVIALSGLASLPLFLNIDKLLGFAPAFADTTGLKFLLAITLLVIPTTAMGATFPVMAAILVRSQSDIGSRIGLLYGFNTLGAVAGAVLGGFVLIPTIGMNGSIYVAVVLNLTVCIVALALGSLVTLPPIETAEAAEPDNYGVMRSTRSGSTLLAGGALVVTGFGSIAVQVGWTKYIAIFTGSTIYGFSAILAVFLSGIALGSLLVRRFIDNTRDATLALGAGLVSLATTMLLTRWGLGGLPWLQTQLNTLDLQPWQNALIRYGAVAILLLPPTFILGMLFPVNLKVFCGGLEGVRARVGLAYALNTIAGIAGAIVAGFVIIPIFGTDFLLQFVAFGTALFALLWVFFLNGRVLGAYVTGSAVAIAAVFILPGIDYRSMISSVGYDDGSGKQEFLFLEEGKAGVISLTTRDDGKSVRLQNNGLNESSFEPGNKNYSLTAEALLAIIPIGLHRNPQTTFVVGFGAGHTTNVLRSSQLQNVRVAELEPAVVKAGLAIDTAVADILADPKVTLTINDARNTLIVEDRKYDLIVSQPSHPWVSGAANVFTQEFWEVAKSRMNEDGIFSQWINLFSMNTSTLKSILKAFFNVFPNGYVFTDTNYKNMILVGSAEPAMFNLGKIDELLAIEKVTKLLNPLGITSGESILKYYAFSRAVALLNIGEEVVPNRDTNLISEVHLSSGLQSSSDKEDPRTWIRNIRKLDLSNYLEGDKIYQLGRIGSYFLKIGWTSSAMKIAEEIKATDKRAGIALQYKALIAADRYHEAFELFYQHDNWDDLIVLKNVNALVRLGFFPQAESLADTIADKNMQQEVKATLDFFAGEYEPLSAIAPSTAEMMVWKALALAKTDLDRGADLLLLAKEIPTVARIEVTQTHLRRAALHDRSGDMIKYSRQLARQVRMETKALAKIAKSARTAGNIEVYEAAIRQIKVLDPRAAVLKEL